MKFKRKQKLSYLEHSVDVIFDSYGVPTITVQSKVDAMRALGYLCARDRLFQMDLMRRLAAGRLSEIMGKATVEFDISQRHFGFHRLAPTILQHLANDQREILQAYAEGVNAFLEHMKLPPLECIALRYKLEKWRPEDSILVYFSMFQSLTGGAEEDERMMTIMAEALPPEVFAFLTPDEDSYTATLIGGAKGKRPSLPVPVEQLASLCKASYQKKKEAATLVKDTVNIKGSNGWVVAKSKTGDGRAILANDMHLPLSVPNTWYRATLCYEGREISGMTLPGLPGIVVGSNGAISWGFTNTMGDYLDLVQLELNPDHQNEYKVGDGWRQFEMVEESLSVRGKPPVSLSIKTTIWGPVSPRLLLGHPVAVHWTALDPCAVDIGITSMDRATTLEEALDILHQFGGPPLHTMLADKNGRIAWTCCGKIPVRRGNDGSLSKSWADGSIGWDGYIPESEVPFVIDPPSGFLVTANNRVIGAKWPYTVGHNFSNGYRAYHIGQKLEGMDDITEGAMFELQLNTESGFYEFYRELALGCLKKEVIAENRLLKEARESLLRWDGKAENDSQGISLLVQFRTLLMEGVFAPYVAPCRAIDNDFTYFWFNSETPLRLLLTQKIRATLPAPHYKNWDAFLVGKLEESVKNLKKTYRVKNLSQLTWGQTNRAAIKHPLAAIPGLGKFLNMSRSPLPGSPFCIRFTLPWNSASMRLVVSPGHEHNGILHMPGGQSGNPFSPHYRDQQRYWVEGRPLPFLSKIPAHALCLTPGP